MVPADRLVYRHRFPDVGSDEARIIVSKILIGLCVAQMTIVGCQVVHTELTAASLVFNALDFLVSLTLLGCLWRFEKLPAHVYGLFIALNILCLPIKLFWGMIGTGLVNWTLSWQMFHDVFEVLKSHHGDASILSIVYFVVFIWKLALLVTTCISTYFADRKAMRAEQNEPDAGHEMLEIELREHDEQPQQQAEEPESESELENEEPTEQNVV